MSGVGHNIILVFAARTAPPLDVSCATISGACANPARATPTLHPNRRTLSHFFFYYFVVVAKRKTFVAFVKYLRQMAPTCLGGPCSATVNFRYSCKHFVAIGYHRRSDFETVFKPILNYIVL